MTVPIAVLCLHCVALASAYSRNHHAETTPNGGALSAHISGHEPVFLHPEHLESEHSRIRRDGAYEMKVAFSGYGHNFDLRLSHTNGVFAPDYQLDFVTDMGVKQVVLDRSKYMRGYVAGYGRHTSDVRAQLEKGRLRASIYIKGKTFRLEPATRTDHPLLDAAFHDESNHVLYSESDVIDHSGHDHSDHPFCGLTHSHSEHGAADGNESHHTESFTEKMFAESAKKKAYDRYRRDSFGNTCDMHLIADHRYFANVGGSDLLATQNRLIDILESTNQIWTFTGFDGVGKQIHLAIRRITVFNTTTASVLTFSNPHSVDTDDSNTFLQQLSAVDHSSYCLAHTLTFQDFTGGVLGLAYVGTLCAVSGDNNCGITTALNQGAKSSDLQTSIVFAHEVGHNFGMSHDNSCQEWCDTQESGTCYNCNGNGQEDCVSGGAFGNFIMWPTAVDGLSPNNNKFSGCSTLSAGDKILSSSGSGGFCFRDGENTPICGNAVTEEGEACDCGVLPENANEQVWIDYCASIDPCCTVNCTLQPEAECSPLSGSCCNSSCLLTGVAIEDVDPITLQPLALEAAADHMCRAETDCTHAAYCIRNESFEGDCPSVNYPYDNATVAAEDYAFHKPSESTLCSDSRATCLNGSCIGSLCAFFKSALHANVSSTACVDESRPCAVACSFEGGIGCVSSFDFATTPEIETEGYSVNETVQDQNKPAGTTCADYTGYCNDAGVCESVSVDSPLDLLSSINVEAWIWENWYIILGIELGIILFAFLLRWSNKDKDTSRWVHTHLRIMRDKLSANALALLNKNKESLHGKRNRRRMERRKKRQQLRELAILYGESHRLQVEGKVEQQRLEAFARLKVLFPHSQDHVLRQIIQLSPDEEAAVGRLLSLGHAMWKVTDYKMLHYAVKRYNRENKAKANTKSEEADLPQPEDTGYLRMSAQSSIAAAAAVSVQTPIQGDVGRQPRHARVVSPPRTPVHTQPHAQPTPMRFSSQQLPPAPPSPRLQNARPHNRQAQAGGRPPPLQLGAGPQGRGTVPPLFQGPQ